jgi:SAM-dependent methyltransferase
MSEAGQAPESAAKNRSFFAANERYASGVAELETYRNIRAAIDAEVRGLDHLLDIGNGGVFDYDTSLARRITAVDLFLDDLPRDAFPPNVTPRSGDALALDDPDGRYDGVLLALVVHHLIGRTADDLARNARRALAEAHRVLRPGGKLIVVESCVAPWFRRFEQVAFRPFARLAGTPVMRHPATLQLAVPELTALVAEQFAVRRVDRIPVGRWILQLGVRWPTALTPARPWVITALR